MPQPQSKKSFACIINPTKMRKSCEVKRFFKNFIIICHNYTDNFSIFVAQYSINNPTTWLLIAGI